MTLRLACFAILVLSAAATNAAPTVSNTTISWPDDGWYQVQEVTDSGNVEVCQGGRSCEVSPGEYIVINLSSGERFEGIIVTDGEGTPTVSVTGNVISWPDNGWYQVLNESNYNEVCGGTLSCTVAPGSYLVINHTTGERFAGITVNNDNNGPSPIVVTNNTISWPDDGWYQVQSALTYQSLCEGGTSCTVANGSYVVINHTTGARWEDVIVGESDPPMRTTTRVDFDITVPVFMPSDELQVRLTWGDIDANASWVSGESWTLSENFPTNTEQALVVTFNDDNGAITLGSFETSFRTGSSESESFQIYADQFNTADWDNDGDGVSNLDELIAGTDPDGEDDSQLEIHDYFVLGSVDRNRMSVWRNFKALVSDSRPLVDTIDIDTIDLNPQYPDIADKFGDINIDENGNGTLTYGYYWPIDNVRYTGTRTHSGSSILWEGSRGAYDGDHRHAVSFSNTVTVVDENTRELVEELSGSNIGTQRNTWETSSDLTGTLIQGTSLCKPVAGTFSSIYRLSQGAVQSDEYSVSKEIDDSYWRVVRVVTRQSGNNTQTTEHLVRELIMFKPRGVDVETVAPEDKYFKCDFVDIQESDLR